jgi:hypothetical protein
MFSALFAPHIRSMSNGPGIRPSGVERGNRRKARCARVNRQFILGNGTLLSRVNAMTARAGVWKRKREDLKKRRAPQFKRYEKSPNDLGLALEIRLIDDQIAQCTEQMARENAVAGASSRSFAATSGQRTRPASVFA